MHFDRRVRPRLLVIVLAAACFEEGANPQEGGGESTSTGTGSTTSTTATTTNGESSTAPTTTSATSLTSSSSSSDVTSLDSGTTDDATTATTDPTMGTCGPGEVELAPIPDGWQLVAVREQPAGSALPCPPMLDEVARGYASGAPESCACRCAGTPDEICEMTLVTDVGCPVGGMVIGIVDQPCVSIAVGQSGIEWSATGFSCLPQAELGAPADGAQTLQACALPPPQGACAMVPPMFDGPCIFGGPGQCPPGYDTPVPFGNPECSPCAAGCDTNEYCESVTATPWSMVACAGEAGTPLAESPLCNQVAGQRSVQFAAVGEPACPPVDTIIAMDRVCCA